jgi:hypothetical protein
LPCHDPKVSEEPKGQRLIFGQGIRSMGEAENLSLHEGIPPAHIEVK